MTDAERHAEAMLAAFRTRLDELIEHDEMRSREAKLSTMTLDPDTLMKISDVRRMAKSGELRAERERLGLSMGDVARAIGTSVATISRWEAERRRPRAEYALRYAELLRRGGVAIREAERIALANMVTPETPVRSDEFLAALNGNVRTRNLLLRNGFHTLGDIAAVTEAEFRTRLYGAGTKTVQNISAALRRAGITWPQEAADAAKSRRKFTVVRPLTYVASAYKSSLHLAATESGTEYPGAQSLLCGERLMLPVREFDDPTSGDAAQIPLCGRCVAYAPDDA